MSKARGKREDHILAEAITMKLQWNDLEIFSKNKEEMERNYAQDCSG